jgi:hypothetical protein
MISLSRVFSVAVMLTALALPLTVQAKEMMHPGAGEAHHQKGEWMKQADTNGDGMISKSEHAMIADQKFAKKDTNGDGQISKEEMKAFHELHKMEWSQNQTKGNWQPNKGKMQSQTSN